MKITFVIGTRPELIKLAPLIKVFKKSNFDVDILNTAQHKELLAPYWKNFDITPNITLDIMVPGQSLSSLTSKAIGGINDYIENVSIKPDFVMAQGDTTTVMAASLVCFYQKIKFLHLEAGLRSFDKDNPFPEELNRRIASLTTFHHFCPTRVSSQNLINEGVLEKNISIVGNTVVDSLNDFMNSPNFKSYNWINQKLLLSESFKKIVLITCHRRENHGINLNEIIESINYLSKSYPEFLFVWPIHPNPNVINVVKDKILKTKNILIVEPLEYFDLLKLLSKSVCAISDSGGIQEEAPSFKVPVIVLREVTERPEGISSGLAFLVGANKDKIVEKFQQVIDCPPKFSSNPYGNGDSSVRIFNLINDEFAKA